MTRYIGIFLSLLILVACTSKPPTDTEINNYIKESSDIYNMLVTAQNENRDLTSDEESKFTSYDKEYGTDSNYYKRLEGEDYKNHQMLHTGILGMKINQGTTVTSYLNDAVDDFWDAQESVKSYFAKIDPSISLTAPRTIETSSQEQVSTEDIIDEVQPDSYESQEINHEPLPARLVATKERLKETYPDSFSTQESLFIAATEDYYRLETIWSELTDEEKKALEGSNKRLEKTYYESPSTHLSLLESEIESYKNLNN